jgi:TonB family protein
MNPPVTAPIPDTTTSARPDEPTVAPAAGPPLDGGIFELGSVDVAPRLLERVDPQVPRRRFWGPASARIELVVVIDRMGRVASASVHSTTDESLVAPSLQAVRLWRFSPASKRGQAVPVRVAVPLVFQNS